jgi:hypothetical protein
VASDSSPGVLDPKAWGTEALQEKGGLPGEADPNPPTRFSCARLSKGTHPSPRAVEPLFGG